MTAYALVCEHVQKQYGDHLAVRDVSFAVPVGSIYGVLGPNGAGKSTMMRMINDIIKPTHGKITLFDGITPGLAAAAKIGFLPEERGLYPKMTAHNMVQFMGEVRGQTRAEATRRASAWLEKLGLGHWRHARVSTLSKGMQQKVQFACALIHEPELLILDEPWSGLDPINADVLRQVVVEHAKSGRTVVFSTHQMEQAEKLCDHVCIIARGTTVLAGALVDVLAEGGVARVRIGFREARVAAAARALLGVATAPGGDRAGTETDLEVLLDHATSVEAIVRQLVAHDLVPTHVEPCSQSLHDIFVHKVGDAARPERSAGDTVGASGTIGPI